MAKKQTRREVPLIGEVIDVARHRNGVSGEGFYAVLFRGARGSDVDGKQFVATVFDDAGYVAVLALGDLADGDARGCYRGDAFATELREAIRVWNEEAGAC